MKIKKLKIKLNKDNEYSDYRYFIPKSNNIKMTDGRDVDEAVQSLKDKIANLKEQADYLINKAPLVKYAEGASIILTDCAEAPLRKFSIEGNSYQDIKENYNILIVDEEHCKKSHIDASNITYLSDGWVQIENVTDAMTYINYTAPTEHIVSGKSYTLKVEFEDINKCNVFLQSANEDYSKVTGATGYITHTATSNFMNALISLNASLTIKIRLTLYEGTEWKEWVPYGGSPSLNHPSEIKNIETTEIYVNNRNLFDKNNALKAIAAKEAEYVSTAYIPVKPGDIITKNNKTYLFIYDNTKTQIVSKTGWTTGTIEEENAAYVRCNVSKTELDTFMIVKNQELPKQYIKGQSQIKTLHTQQPFRAIGNVKDRFIKKDGVWYEEHNINRKVYKGTETFKVTPNGNKLQIFVNDLSDIGKVGSFCNMLKSVNNIWNISEYQDIIKVSDNLTAINIMLQNTEINTVSLLKEKLTTLYNIGTPLYVDYILKTPTLIPCTTEQIEILDNLQSYDKITYYNVDKINNIQANIKLIYKQDIDAILEEEGV